MSFNLSDEEIKKRLSRLTNLEKLHAKDQITKKEQRAEIKALKATVAEQAKTIETLLLRLGDLEKKVFGSKSPQNSSNTDPSFPIQKKSRTRDSYKRAIPTKITHTENHTLPEACTCGGSFDDIEVHTRYVEDIPLPELTKDYEPIISTKHTIEKGICIKCKTKKTAHDYDLGGSHVRLGGNMRLLICSLITRDGLSYDQVISLIQSLYNLDLASGEITRILTKQHEKWLPDYERLKDDIRKSRAVHMDETSWKLQEERSGYLWVFADAFSYLVAFVFADSRGKGHAEKLLGKSRAHRITDNCPVYTNLPGKQQLCWVHLYRVIRDLKNNANLHEKYEKYVTQWYRDFAEVYKELRDALEEEYDRAVRAQKTEELWERLEALCQEQQTEPLKLTQLKKQLLKAGKERLFLCLIEDIPCDNNRAERELRPLVIKRKRSFGSKTKQGALALSTVTSLCVSTWRESRENYFQRLAQLG